MYVNGYDLSFKSADFSHLFCFNVCGKNARAENAICKNVRGKMQQVKLPEATW